MKRNRWSLPGFLLAGFSGLLFCASCAAPHALATRYPDERYSADADAPVINSVEEFFLHTDYLVREGRYPEALASARRIYNESSDPSVREEALFRMVFLLAYGNNAKRDLKESENLAGTFLGDYPQSRRLLEVKGLRLLLQEIGRGEGEIDTLKQYNTTQGEKIQALEEDLRKIKEIDLQLEEQKKKLE